MPVRTSLLLAMAIVGHLEVGTVCAQTIFHPERRIVSLASAPELLEARAIGRDSVLMRLLFPNDCFARAGAIVKAGTPTSGTPHAAVLQQPDPQGCPEIYDPVEARVLVRIAADIWQGNTTLRLVARPAPVRIVAPPSVSELEATASDAALEGATVIEAHSFEEGFGLPAIQVAGINPARSEGGYDVRARAWLAETCSAADLRLHVFEVPNSIGTPLLDVLVLTSPNACLGRDGADVTFHVGTPQPNAGRSIYIANEPDPAPRPLS